MKEKKLQHHPYTKILVPAQDYRLDEDTRILIPFTAGPDIGFIDKNGNVVVKAQYNMYYGDFYNVNDLVKVSKVYTYGFDRKTSGPATYHRSIYGLLDINGNEALPVEYSEILISIKSKRLYTVQSKDGQYAVLDDCMNEVIPFGKYDYIDGFDHGFARVKIGHSTNANKETANRWGIIDERGYEVLPLIYTNIWNFYGKDRTSTRIIDTEGTCKLWHFFSKNTIEERPMKNTNSYYEDSSDYLEWSGGWTRDEVESGLADAFEGDRDALWNID